MRTFRNNFYEEPETESFARTNFSRVYSVRANGVRGGGTVDEPRNNMVFLTVIAVLAVLILGVLSLVLGARVSEFDYKISEQEQVVTELAQKRAELVLENAKSSSYSSVQGSDLARSMTP
jgi:hypothetical protein